MHEKCHWFFIVWLSDELNTFSHTAKNRQASIKHHIHQQRLPSLTANKQITFGKAMLLKPTIYLTKICNSHGFLPLFLLSSLISVYCTVAIWQRCKDQAIAMRAGPPQVAQSLPLPQHKQEIIVTITISQSFYNNNKKSVNAATVGARIMASATGVITVIQLNGSIQ